MKGFIVFFVNFFPEQGQDVEATINVIRNQNKAIIDKITTETGYEVMFVPTTKEATRVEKVDFDKPFPRFMRGATPVLETEEEND